VTALLAVLLQTVTVAADTPDIECPASLSGFERTSATERSCRYEDAAGASLSITIVEDAPAADSRADRAPRLASTPPAPFRGATYHAGETQSGDQRLSVWRLPLGQTALELRARYAIPLTAPARVRAAATAFADANSLSPVTESEQAECPAGPDGFSLEERMTGLQAGFATRWSCAYLNRDIFGFYYAPASNALALSGFQDQISEEAQSASPPEGAPAPVSMVLDKGVYRGLWVWGEGDKLRALELDWEPDEPESAVLDLLQTLSG